MTSKADALNARPVMNVKEAAQKWGVSIRRVSKLCQDGRVDGAYKLSARMWLIPVDAEKPGDWRGLKVSQRKTKKHTAAKSVRKPANKPTVDMAVTGNNKKEVG